MAQPHQYNFGANIGNGIWYICTC